MELAIYRSLFCFPGDAAAAARSAREDGYDGLEALWPRARSGQAELVSLVREEDLDFAPLATLDGVTPEEQWSDLLRSLEELEPHAPERIVVHSGKDGWRTPETIAFYRRIVDSETEFGLNCAHETHRGRTFGTPWATLEVLEEVPGLALCCDFSHWVLVCERLLEDQGPALALGAERALHLHARVGTAQAPQVRDPAAPEFATELASFEGWWEMVWRAQQRAGHAVTTVSPEYGPPPYQPVDDDPATLAARLGDICDWQMSRLRASFERLDLSAS